MIATIKEDTNKNEPMSYLGRESLIAEYARKRHSGLINDYERNYFTYEFQNVYWDTTTEGGVLIPVPPDIYNSNYITNNTITNVHTLEMCTCRSIYTSDITLGGDNPSDFYDLPIQNLGFFKMSRSGYDFLCSIASNGTLFIRFPNGKQFKEGNTVIGDSQGTLVGTTNITLADMWYAENITQDEWYSSGHEYTSIFSTITVVVAEELISFYCNGKRTKTYTNSGAGNEYLTLPNYVSNDMTYGIEDGSYGWGDDAGSMVCAVRLYDRVLTDDEIANNALQDKLLYL